MKECTVCRQNLPYDKYYNSKATKDGKAYRCKECESRVVKEYKQRYRERTKEWQRQRNRKSKYGVSPEDYKNLRDHQDDKCAICETQMDFNANPDMKIRAVIDHCHTSNKVRGLLCARCNQALGLFEDSTESLANAIKYLTKGIRS